MHMINIIIIFAIVLGITIPLVVLKDKLNKDKVILATKILAIVLFSLGILRNFLNDSFIWVINGGTYSHIYYKVTDITQSILRWFMTLSFIVFPCAAFFKHRVLKNWAIYFCLPVAIVCTAFYSDFLTYFTTDSGRALPTPDWFRHIEFSLELIIMMVLPLLLRFVIGHKFNVKDKFEWINFFGLLPLALIVVIPVVLPQSLFGFTDRYMMPFSFENIMWILIVLGLFVGIYFAYRFKDRETRYMICIFLSLYLFYHYNSIYLMDFLMSRMPFQLCNLGSYLVLIALLVKKQGFYNFIVIANVTGAMIAFCLPDIDEGMLSFWNIHFYIEHTWVFVIPLLIVALRIADRPKLSAIKHFFIGFSCYFLFCAAMGIVANCYLYDPTKEFFNKVNYFYIFDSTVLEVLKFLGFTTKWAVNINNFVFYPLYMFAIYILYSVLCLAVYYIYVQLCKLGDDHFKMRGVRIGLLEERGRYKNRKRIPKKIYED